MMGQEIPIDEVSGNNPVEAEHIFAPVSISPLAIDTASRVVPQEHFAKEGVYSFLKKRADFIFSKMTVNQTEARLKGLDYFFEYSASGPVLKNVKLVQV